MYVYVCMYVYIWCILVNVQIKVRSSDNSVLSGDCRSIGVKLWSLIQISFLALSYIYSVPIADIYINNETLTRWLNDSLFYFLDYPTSSDNSTTTLYDESVSHTTVRVLKKHDEHQHKLFKEFHQHVAENKIRDLQIMKNTNGSKCSFLVIRPAPAFLHIFYNVAPGYIVVQALSPCTQPRANKVIQEVERIITKEYGINIGTEHDASTWQTKLPMLSQNVALPTISEVEKLRIFQLLKKSEDENKQSQKEHSQELKLKQDECNREIKNKEDEYNKEMKSKDDKCDKIIKRKGDECGREVKSKEEECTKNLEKMSNNCDQKMKKIKDGVQACHKEMIKGMEDRTKETERKLFKQSKKMVELTKQMKTLERELKKKVSLYHDNQSLSSSLVIGLSVYVLAFLSVCLPVCFTVSLFVCLPVCLPSCLFVCLFVCSSICQLFCLSICYFFCFPYLLLT